MIQTIKKKYNEWDINIMPDLSSDSLIIRFIINDSFSIYESSFKFEFLNKFNLFVDKNSIGEIICLIGEIIEKNNIRINQNKNFLNFIICSSLNEKDNIRLIINKKDKFCNEIFDKVIEKIEYLSKKNEELNQKIEFLENKNQNFEKRIINIEKLHNKKDKELFQLGENIKIKNKNNYFEMKINELEKSVKILTKHIDSLIQENKIANLNLKQIDLIKTHKDFINSISIFPSGKIITVSSDKSIKIYDNYLNLLQHINNAHENKIINVDIKDENNFITCSNDKCIKVWIKNSQKENENEYNLYQTIKNAHNDSIWKVIYCENGNIISCSEDKSIKIWEEKNTKEYQSNIILLHPINIKSILLFNNKNILISSGFDGTKFWNILNYECINYIRKVKCYTSGTLKKYDKDKIIIGEKLIYIIQINSFQDIQIIKEINHGCPCLAICVIKEKNIFLIGGEGRELRIYRNDNFCCIQIIKEAHNFFIKAICQLKDGLIVTCSNDSNLKLWSF